MTEINKEVDINEHIKNEVMMKLVPLLKEINNNTSNPASIASAQIMAIREVWNNYDIKWDLIFAEIIEKIKEGALKPDIELPNIEQVSGFDNIILAYEREIISWIKENYQELGFEKIIEKNDRKCPDFVMLRNGKEVRVEVEIYSSSFIKHKHNPNDVDMILCLVDDAKLPIKTEIIKQLKLWYHLTGDDLVDFFKALPDSLLINHKTHATLYHFQKDWLNLTAEREMQIRKNLKEKKN